MLEREEISPQLHRPEVIRGEGVTPSERYLARLAEKSFLNLWSYPNPFRDQQQRGKGDGKELCDLLVVCGKHIIIFSEKSIAWPAADLGVAWARWAKRAIYKAAQQAKGAERWITEHPDRIFLAPDCKNPFPLDIPPPEGRVIHRVVVVRGAAEECKKYFPGNSGSLVINPSITGNKPWSGKEGSLRPFEVGDIDPLGSFVHVLNESSLEIVMRELDTIRDFTDYLEKKVQFLRSGRLLRADGEENLLAYYAIRINKKGEHDFVSDNGHEPLTIDKSHYANLVSHPKYILKKQADEISYVWDEMIKSFTNNMLQGTSLSPFGYKFDLKKSEFGVRYMALERRFYRRSHGEALKGALERGATEDKFFRGMISKKGETAFFILTLKVKAGVFESYEQYREARTGYAQLYARGLLEKTPHLKRVVGISREPFGQDGGVSEDMVYAEQAEWTHEERRKIRSACEKANVLTDSMKTRPWSGEEFPGLQQTAVRRGDLYTTNPTMNRKQRRAQMARQRRSRRNRRK